MTYLSLGGVDSTAVSRLKDEAKSRAYFLIPSIKNALVFPIATISIEVVLNQEVVEPFRRDAMKTPVESRAWIPIPCALSK